MTNSASPLVATKFRAFTPAAIVPSGYYLHSFVAGTTTPQATYTDATATVANANPLALDAYGQAQVWLKAGLTYKIQIRAGNQITDPLVEEADYIAGGESASLRADLALASDPTKGDAMIAVKQPFAGAVARTQHDKNSECVSVLDFGIVADGVTDNTANYSAMISTLPEYSTIVWPFGTYKGDFISNKSFRLIGNGSIIIPSVNSNAIDFQGTISAPSLLSVAPAFGAHSLSGVSGLSGDTMVMLYSGNLRPSDSQPVNYEVLKIKSDGTVLDKVYSDQNGGTPTYQVITPLKEISIDNFKFEPGTTSSNSVYIRYADDVKISNIKMVSGAGSTIECVACMSLDIKNIFREKPSDVTSGSGYNVSVLSCKYVDINNVYGDTCRHDVDTDSTYVINIDNVNSINSYSSSVVPAHNGFGGYCNIKNLTVKSDSYAINTSSQGAASPTSLKYRALKIENVNISNNVDMSSDSSYVGIYFQTPIEDFHLKNINIKNTNNPTSFNYAGAAYNSNYFVIRVYSPIGSNSISNINADAAACILWLDSAGSSSDNLPSVNIDNVSVKYFRDVVTVNAVTSGVGGITLRNVTFYETGSVYGRAVVSILSNNRMERLIINDISKIPTYTKLVSLAASGAAPLYSSCNMAGYSRRTSINGVASGGTITQLNYLECGDFAIWGSTTKTLSATTPIEKPILTGNIFAIFNYGSGTLTIPGGSNTVDNAANIDILPNETHYFKADSTGQKWTRYKKTVGDSL